MLRYLFHVRVLRVDVPRLGLGRACGNVVSGDRGFQAGTFAGRECTFRFRAASTVNLSGGLVYREDQPRGAPYDAVIVRFLQGRFAAFRRCLFGLSLHVRGRSIWAYCGFNAGLTRWVR